MRGTNSLIQNLGPGTLYVGSNLVTKDDGVQVLPGQAIQLGAVSLIGLIAESGSCDVRVQVGAAGIFDASTPAP